MRSATNFRRVFFAPAHLFFPLLAGWLAAASVFDRHSLWMSSRRRL